MFCLETFITIRYLDKNITQECSKMSYRSVIRHFVDLVNCVSPCTAADNL